MREGGLNRSTKRSQLRTGERKKIRPFRGKERPVLAKSSGEEGKLVYKDGPVGCPVAEVAGALPEVLVINRTSTRRFLARPSRVLFESTGLSLPRPIT